MQICRFAHVFMLLAFTGCATLGQAIQPPTFAASSGQPAELRLAAPSLARPLGGATVRLYAEVGNPNPFGLVLSSLAGQFALEGIHAADVDFPLGVPLAAGQSSTVPLDISISFADLPNLADVVGRAATGQQLNYTLSGRIGVDAGVLGQPTFGPLTLLSGQVGR